MDILYEEYLRKLKLRCYQISVFLEKHDGSESEIQTVYQEGFNAMDAYENALEEGILTINCPFGSVRRVEITKQDVGIAKNSKIIFYTEKE